MGVPKALTRSQVLCIRRPDPSHSKQTIRCGLPPSAVGLSHGAEAGRGAHDRVSRETTSNSRSGFIFSPGTSGRHPLKIYRSQEGGGIVDLAQSTIPYILTAALIALGAILTYLILTTGPASQSTSKSTTSAGGTSVYSGGIAASLSQTSNPTKGPSHSPAVVATLERFHGR